MARRVLDESDSEVDSKSSAKKSKKVGTTPVKKEAEATPKKKNAEASPKKTTVKKESSTAAGVKKEVKFNKTGQKKETPAELDVLRMFYESAYLENPGSEMAARWCVQHGLLAEDLASKLVNNGFKLSNPNKLKPTSVDKSKETKTATEKKKETKAESATNVKEEPSSNKRKAEETKPAVKKAKVRSLDDSDEE